MGAVGSNAPIYFLKLLYKMAIHRSLQIVEKRAVSGSTIWNFDDFVGTLAQNFLQGFPSFWLQNRYILLLWQETKAISYNFDNKCILASTICYFI